MMTENQIYTLVIAALQTGLTAMGLPLQPTADGITVKQRYQSTNQGVPANPTLYVHLDSVDRYGYPGRKDTFDSVSGSMIHGEGQTYIANFQISATSIDSQTNPNAMAVGDLVKAAAFTLNSDAARISLRSSGLAVERIKTIRKTHFRDEKGRDEENPTFDCSFVYFDVITSTNPATDKVTVTLYPV